MAPGQKTAAALERSERTGSFYPAPELVVDATKRAWAGAGQNEQNEGPRNRKKTSQTLRHKKGAWNAANADTEYAEQCANWAGDQDEGKRKEREERAMTREEKEFILDSAEKNPHLDMKELNRLLEDVMRPSLSQESIDDLMKDAHRVFRTNPADSNDEKADGSASDDSDNFQPRQAKQKQEGNFLGRAFNALRLNNATAAAKQPEKSPMLPKKAPKNPWKNIARLARAQAAADPGLEERALLDFQDGGDGIRPEDAMGEEEDVVNYDVGVFGAQPRMARVGQFEEEENSILEFLCTVDWMADQWGGHGTKLRFDRGGTGEVRPSLPPPLFSTYPTFTLPSPTLTASDDSSPRLSKRDYHRLSIHLVLPRAREAGNGVRALLPELSLPLPHNLFPNNHHTHQRAAQARRLVGQPLRRRLELREPLQQALAQARRLPPTHLQHLPRTRPLSALW